MRHTGAQQEVQHRPFQENPFFGQYVTLLIHPHAAMRHGDEDEAERLREKMDGPGLHLNLDEIRWVKRLSADLYRLNGDESFRPLDHPSNHSLPHLTEQAWTKRDNCCIVEARAQLFPAVRVNRTKGKNRGPSHIRHRVYGRHRRCLSSRHTLGLSRG